MMRKRLIAAAAAALVGISGVASAQVFPTDTFDGQSALPQWTFAGLTGVFNAPFTNDDYLFISNLPGDSATFSFNAQGDVPFYRVQFRHAGGLGGNVNFQAGALNLNEAIPAAATILTNPGGGTFDYYFGAPILNGTPVSITITSAGLIGLNVDNFSVAAVPEPSTYALMLAGLGVVGFAARRRRAGASQSALAAA